MPCPGEPLLQPQGDPFLSAEDLLQQVVKSSKRPLEERSSSVAAAEDSKASKERRSCESPSTLKSLPAAGAAAATASNEDVYRFQEEIDVCGNTEQ